MRLDLIQFRQPETELHKLFQPADLAAGDEEYRVTAPVDLRMAIHKDQDRYRLVGTVKTELEMACSRCLEPFKCRSTGGRFTVLLQGPLNGNRRDDEELRRDDDVSLTLIRDEQIDLRERCRAFYIASDEAAVLRGCKGICPHVEPNGTPLPRLQPRGRSEVAGDEVTEAKHVPNPT